MSADTREAALVDALCIRCGVEVPMGDDACGTCEHYLTPAPTVRAESALLVAAATVAEGVWSLAVRDVHPLGRGELVHVPAVEMLDASLAQSRTLDLDSALIEVGYHRATGWMPHEDHTRFTCHVRPFPVVLVPYWAEMRYDVRPVGSGTGDVSVTFERSMGSAGHDFESECSVYVTQEFRIVDGRLTPEQARAHVHAEAPSHDHEQARQVAAWLLAAADLVETINAGVSLGHESAGEL